MDRLGINAQNMVISIPLRSIPMTMFHLNSFVNIYADFHRKSIRLLTLLNMIDTYCNLYDHKKGNSFREVIS